MVLREDLRAELLAMAEEDLAVREELARDGSLFQGYAPRMEEVHRRNAERLGRILDAHGWPGRALVGDDGMAAAWLVLQHALPDPALMRRGLEIAHEAAQRGEIDAAGVAMLEDRIRVLEGRPQRYGTQHDWDAAGSLGPLPMEDSKDVDERRRAAGLEPLAKQTLRIREQAARERERPPADREARQLEMEAWAHRVGWRT